MTHSIGFKFLLFILAILLVFVMLASVLAGCEGGEAAPAAAARTDVNVSINKALTSLDPHGTSLLQDNIVLWQVFAGLLHFNELTGTTDPDMAESWEVSEDGTVYTFKIRDGVYFHNGKKMTAEDVAYSIRRCMDPNKGRSIYTPGITDAQATDDTTLVITLNAPSAPFLVNMCYVFVVDKDEIEAQGEEYGTKPCSGTGPYMVTELDADQKIV